MDFLSRIHNLFKHSRAAKASQQDAAGAQKGDPVKTSGHWAGSLGHRPVETDAASQRKTSANPLQALGQFFSKLWNRHPSHPASAPPEVPVPQNSVHSLADRPRTGTTLPDHRTEAKAPDHAQPAVLPSVQAPQRLPSNTQEWLAKVQEWNEAITGNLRDKARVDQAYQACEACIKEFLPKALPDAPLDGHYKKTFERTLKALEALQTNLAGQTLSKPQLVASGNYAATVAKKAALLSLAEEVLRELGKVHASSGDSDSEWSTGRLPPKAP